MTVTVLLYTHSALDVLLEGWTMCEKTPEWKQISTRTQKQKEDTLYFTRYGWRNCLHNYLLWHHYSVDSDSDMVGKSFTDSWHVGNQLATVIYCCTRSNCALLGSISNLYLSVASRMDTKLKVLRKMATVLCHFRSNLEWEFKWVPQRAMLPTRQHWSWWQTQPVCGNVF